MKRNMLWLEKTYPPCMYLYRLLLLSRQFQSQWSMLLHWGNRTAESILPLVRALVSVELIISNKVFIHLENWLGDYHLCYFINVPWISRVNTIQNVCRRLTIGIGLKIQVICVGLSWTVRDDCKGSGFCISCVGRTYFWRRCYRFQGHTVDKSDQCGDKGDI